MTPSPTETLTATVEGNCLELFIQQQRIAKSGWPIYALTTVLINGQKDYTFSKKFFSPYMSVKLLKSGLALLDTWCSQHPHSFLATENYYLVNYFDYPSTFWRFIENWGVAHDGRCDTWVACIDDNGQRVLYPGMLNLIADCLDVWDLWRVAKDTNYFLGHLETTPVAIVAFLLGNIGIETLPEEDEFIIEGDFQSLFQQYIECFGDHYKGPDQGRHALPRLVFHNHPLGSQPIYVIPFIPYQEQDIQDVRFYYGVHSLGILGPGYLKLFEQIDIVDTREVDQETMEKMGEQLLALNPSHGELL